MRAKDLVVGESYRHKDHPRHCWAKVKRVLKPKEHPNTNNFIIVECEWTQDKDGLVGLIKYFKPSNLVKPK